MRNFDVEPADLDQLQADYIYALDTQNMEQWLAQFHKDPAASYTCITRENVKNNLPVAFMLDDCYARLQDRVSYVTKVWAGTFQNYQTRHLTQRLRYKKLSEDTIEMRTGFSVYCSSEESGVAEILTTGEYEDIVRMENSELRFLSKKVILDTSVLPRYIVYPL